MNNMYKCCTINTDAIKYAVQTYTRFMCLGTGMLNFRCFNLPYMR